MLFLCMAVDCVYSIYIVQIYYKIMSQPHL